MEAGIRAARETENAAIADAENADPMGLITAEDLARANAQRGFANDQADMLDVGSLVARLGFVLAAGDNASVFAHWMAGRRRRERILASRPEGVARGAATELDDVLGGMREHLDGGRPGAAVEAARGRLREVEEVAAVAYLTKHETDRAYDPSYSVPARQRKRCRDEAWASSGGGAPSPQA